MAVESPPTVPAVVVVVVTYDPGPWFPEALTALAAQDYPNLSVLVIDAGGSQDPTPAVAAVMPGAFVRRLEHRVGFGTAANEVIDIVEGASHYLFCHDDVALAPDAVRLMVEEAFRSNAGITTPKFVQWQAPDRLLAVGLTTDKVGARRDLVDPGELDQEQHDSVREVLVAPSGATLVRADLFDALGGYDPVVDCDGEDIDLSWRARLLGARIVTVPAARVRHLEAAASGRRVTDPGPGRRERNRYRTILACYRLFTLAWLLPLALFWALGEAATLLFQGRVTEARQVLSALAGSLRQRPQLRAARRRVQRHRSIGDHQLRILQARGNARLRVFLRSRMEVVRSGLEHQALGLRANPLAVDGPEPDADGREVAPPEPTGGRPRRNLEGAILAVLLIGFVIGTRSLFGRSLPHVATLPDTSIGWAAIWRSWWSAWQPGGLGVAAPASPAMALLGVLATALFGAVGTLEHLVVLGPLVIGPLGAYRAARYWGSRRGRMAAAVTYTVVPLPYNALAAGHWSGLVAYAVTPWVLSLMFGLSNVMPAPPVRLDRSVGRLIGLALLVAVVASVAPSYLYLVPITGLALVAGSALSGRPDHGLRMLGLGAAASLMAFVLLLPWSATVVATRAAVAGVDPGPAGRLGLGQILRFATGPYGTGGWEWLLLVAAALPLFVGRGWRLEWAARLWVLALVFFAVAWAGRRGWVPALPIEVLLSPAAAALAGSVALGVAAFEIDLPGYNFGWRQAAAAVAGISLALAGIPWLAAAGQGRWDLPSADAASALAFLPSPHRGDYRVLWVGQPDALPLAGRQLEPGFAYGTSFDGNPVLADDWASGPGGAGGALAADLLLVEGHLTTKLGHLLAPTGVLFVVVPARTGPEGSGGRPVAVPDSLLAGLGLQTDLKAVSLGDPNYTVYENAAWAPVRSVPPAGPAPAIGGGPAGLRQLEQTDLSRSAPVLTGRASHSVTGQVPSGQNVFVGSTRSAGWTLAVDGRTLSPAPAFGWGMRFQVPPSATSSLRGRLGYSAPLLVRAGYLVQVALWVGAVAVMVLDRRRRRRRGGLLEQADPMWFVPAPVAAPVRRPGWDPGRPKRHPPVPAEGIMTGPLGEGDGDDMWSDV